MADCSEFQRRLGELLRTRDEDLADCAALEDPVERQRCRSGVLQQIQRTRHRLLRCQQPDLTGVWAGDDGGMYFVRQLGDTVCWAGFSTRSPLGVDDFHLGIDFCNVFVGRRTRDRIDGDWADMPRGSARSQGTLALETTIDGELARRAQTGGFGGSRWQRASFDPGPDIRARFDRVYRNDGDTMHDHLKMYKDHVVVFGQAVTGLIGNVPAGADRRYANFMCNADGTWPADDLDGDVFFWIEIAREDLEAQPGFWQDGWMNDPLDIWYKLAANNPDGDNPHVRGITNLMHPEIVMYGRPAGTDNCAGNIPPLLPGWMENSAKSVLWNGRPIDGRVGVADDRTARVLGEGLPLRTAVRVSGFLALDCHGLGCDEDNERTNNVELHPVYAVDVLPDPQVVPPDLTGAWSCSDVGTYYLRQIGDTVWWLGMSRDRGLGFTNVFRGQLSADTISGTWLDVPLGAARSAGTLALQAGAGQHSRILIRTASNGDFGGRRWNRLRYG